MVDRAALIKAIQANIENYGYHVTVVTGLNLPRFSYTIGCKENFGLEIIFAGGEYYSENDIRVITIKIVDELEKRKDWKTVNVELGLLGSFSLSSVDKSWSRLVALGAYDFYDQDDIQFVQILPDKEHITMDIPDMSMKFDSCFNPVWQWLIRNWDYSVPRNSTAVTNLKVLRGEKATEAMRWEVDQWEIFSGAGPDVPKEDLRVVPLGVLLGIDQSLEQTIHLQVGTGLWRDPVHLVWNSWTQT
ncbi:hypothetical protein SAMN04487996_12020 [Dyadobacter soli]|uniref:DUF4262 domain-containing protein n=1 Tax=Dyadobacter soli TaxID=659014 RepID=A0A1G7VBD1_9BACT|nr:DUF4262 domain-containing protein [Dyadobacter soli]SDG56841.1 hypothetical protein SAMN04487996_12020 [Dyadobacter soli]